MYFDMKEERSDDEDGSSACPWSDVEAQIRRAATFAPLSIGRRNGRLVSISLGERPPRRSTNETPADGFGVDATNPRA